MDPILFWLGSILFIGKWVDYLGRIVFFQVSIWFEILQNRYVTFASKKMETSCEKNSPYTKFMIFLSNLLTKGLQLIASFLQKNINS
jgi:hypothetical protein